MTVTSCPECNKITENRRVNGICADGAIVTTDDVELFRWTDLHGPGMHFVDKPWFPFQLDSHRRGTCPGQNQLSRRARL